MTDRPSKDKVEVAFDAALVKHNDLCGIEHFVLDELGIPHDAEDGLLLHINQVVFQIIEDRRLLRSVVRRRVTDPETVEEASTAGYAAGAALTKPERKRIEGSVSGLEYRSMDEGEKIGAEGQALARKARPDLPENHAWHRNFSYGFWGALRPQDGPYAEGFLAGQDEAARLWGSERARVDEACAGTIRNSQPEDDALKRFATEVATKEHPDLSRDRDWLAGWRLAFAGTWRISRERGF